MNPTSLNRSLNLLYPPFRERIEKALSLAHEEKLMAYVFEAWRSRERQAFLFAQGRSTPGPIITNARAGDSLHFFGLAVDVVFDKDPLTPGPQWTWQGNYSALAKIMLAHGLETLKMEQAHFQITYGLKLSEIKQITEAKGILGLWAYLDTLDALTPYRQNQV